MHWNLIDTTWCSKICKKTNFEINKNYFLKKNLIFNFIRLNFFKQCTCCNLQCRSFIEKKTLSDRLFSYTNVIHYEESYDPFTCGWLTETWYMGYHTAGLRQWRRWTVSVDSGHEMGTVTASRTDRPSSSVLFLVRYG